MEPIMNAISIMRSSSGSDVLCDDFQRLLARWNRKRLSPQLPDDAWPYTLERDQRMLRLEGEFMETLRSEVADEAALAPTEAGDRSEEHTSELQSLMRTSYAVFC